MPLIIAAFHDLVGWLGGKLVNADLGPLDGWILCLHLDQQSDRLLEFQLGRDRARALLPYQHPARETQSGGAVAVVILSPCGAARLTRSTRNFAACSCSKINASCLPICSAILIRQAAS